MRTLPPFRLVLPMLGLACAASLLSPASGVLRAQRLRGGFHVAEPAPRMQMAPRAQMGPQNRNPQPREHLQQWMERHSNLTPEQQQRALEQEPGFRQQPPQVQQRMRDTLSHLNSMGPEQRSHTLERMEEMEHLSPPQRQQVRGAMAQLGGLPPDRRRVVARAFRDLRSMSPAERQGTINNYQFRSQFTPAEWATLSNLMVVEPLLPPAANAMPQPPR
ncbi:MAG TPA: DUF3106 domain-containing protein [Granulicella sp.]|jgi:hypothetical protein|nr:DUF3106 domain-containing protein [Granulicella sp.]